MEEKSYPKIAIVTDSTADIPVEDQRRLNITVVPAVLTLDGKSYHDDGEEITRTAFYQQLPMLTAPPSTAAPSPAVFDEVYRRLFEEGVERILSVHLPESLSGMINVARQAAETFGSHVEIFDSGQVSLGTGFQAMEAAAAALSGASFQAVREVALRTREAIRLIAVIDTMEYLKRSGRISWLSANLGDLLKIKVLLEIIDGVVQSLGNVRTRTKAIARIQSLAASWGPLRRMAVVHSDIPEEAKAFAEQIRRFCHEPPLVINVTTVIGAHVGPGALGVIGLRQSP